MLNLIVGSALAQRRRFLLSATATALSIALVCGTILLAQSVRQAYAQLLHTVTAGVDIYVRGPETDRRLGISDFAPVPESLAAQVRNLPGVARADGQVVRLAQLVETGGRFLNAGRPVYALSWPQHGVAGGYALVAGRAPLAPGEVVLDRATARADGLAVGGAVLVSVDVSAARRVMVVGLAAPRDGGDLAGSGTVFLEPAWAQELARIPGNWDLVGVTATPGTTPDVLRARVAAALPADGSAAITSRAYAEAQVQNLSRRSDLVAAILLTLSGLAVVVAVTGVLSSQRILVAQRTRELALWRLLGLTRRQVFQLVIGEAAVVGLVASGAGAVAGIPAAVGLQALVAATGQGVGAVPIVVDPATLLVVVAGGTLLAATVATGSARRATRVLPVEAARTAVVVPGRARWGWLASAVVLPLRGAAAIARHGGAPGRVATRFALRDPRRSLAPVGSLVVALSLLTAATVIVGSAGSSIRGLVSRADRADYVITGDRAPGVDVEVVSKLREAPGIAVVSEVASESFTLGSQVEFVTAIETDTAPAVLSLTVLDGDLHRLRDGAIAMTRGAQLRTGHRVGDHVRARFGEPLQRDLVIVAVVADNGITRDWVVPYETYSSGYHYQTIRAAFVKRRPGIGDVALARQVKAGVAGFPGILVLNPGQFAAAQAAGIERPLSLVQAMVGLAVLLSLLGIMNSLGLSVVERTRDLGLLRAMGMTRGQLAATVRWEAGMIVAVGATAGTAAGLFIGVIFVAALRTRGITQLVVPFDQLATVLGLVLGGGLVAAAVPARRAARLSRAQLAGA